MEQKKWYQLSRKDVLQAVSSKPGGLTQEEAEKRLRDNGKNELPKDGNISPLRILFNQVKSPLVYVLVIAAALSYLVGEKLDVAVILFVVAVNTVVGFWQEYKADKAIAKLKGLITYRVTVLRDGREVRLDSSELAPGDIMLLEAGDKISADARLIESNNFQVNEASLTGESFPVEKHTETIKEEKSVGDRANMVFQGTTSVRGRARAVIVATGKETEIGRIASMVQETKEERTPLQLQLVKLSRFLTLAVLIAAVAVFGIGFLREEPLRELFVTAIALAVAAIPEGLLVSMTLVLVVGMQRILKKKAIVRKLIAAETLGSVSVVCSDKTGTITQGKMVVDQVLVGGEMHEINHASDRGEEGIEQQHTLAIKAAALCNNAYIKNPQDKLKEWEIDGDSTETALLIAAGQLGFDKDRLNSQNPRLDEIPFQEEYKFMATLHKTADGDSMIFVKGAPEIVADMSSHYLKNSSRKKIDKDLRAAMKDEYESLTRQGLRVLAIAQKKVKASDESFDDIVDDRSDPRLDDLDFIGWIGLKDPVREDVPEAFEVMKQAGIRTVIITGDHKYTVQAIVKEIGMNVSDEQIMEGTEVEALSDEELFKRVKDIAIFARVEPNHKLRIVQAWRKHDEVIAVLGDGVNDAPALKSADIGIAVESGTDVAKEASDMILLNSNFAVIQSAVKQGRVIFDNIRKIFLYLMSDSFTEIILIGAALIFGYPLPLAAVQILWINILSDGLPALALASEPAEEDVMKHRPRKKDTPIFSGQIKLFLASVTFIVVTLVSIMYLYLMSEQYDITRIRTMVFCVLAIDSLIYVFSMKSLRNPLWKLHLFSNKNLVLAVFVSLIAQVAIVQIPAIGQYLRTVPLHLHEWGIILGIVAVEIMLFELVKWMYRNYADKAEARAV